MSTCSDNPDEAVSEKLTGEPALFLMTVVMKSFLERLTGEAALLLVIVVMKPVSVKCRRTVPAAAIGAVKSAFTDSHCQH